MRHVALILVLAILIGWPIAMLCIVAFEEDAHVELPLTPRTQSASLALQTAGLVSGTLALAMPVGVTVALLVFRTDLSGARFWAAAVLLPALVPLDLHATAWLAALGPQGWLSGLGFPELKGLLGAAWIHALAAIPWIAGISGIALMLVEAELEEDCLLVAGTFRTIWHVTLRRAAGLIAAAAILVGVLAAGEMAVTDLLQVRTYAETVYTEFAIAGRVGVATATALPGLVLLTMALALAAVLVSRSVPNFAESLSARRPVFHLGAWQPFWLSAVLIVIATSLGVPAGSLVWRAGREFARPVIALDGQSPLTAPSESTPDESGSKQQQLVSPQWSAASLAGNLYRSAWSAGRELLYSLILAALTAAHAVMLGWIVVTTARSATGRGVALITAGLLLAMPGPVLGIGITLALNMPTRWLGVGSPIADALAAVADSSAVLVWLLTLRTLPYAIAVLWPAVRLIDRSVLEMAELDGARAWARFRFVELPACGPAIVAAALAVAVLSIGELAGSVIVAPPGLQPLSVRIFTLAHFGVESYLAGICLLLLLVVVAAGGIVFAAIAWAVRRSS